MQYFINKQRPWELYQFGSMWTRTSMVGIRISGSKLERDVLSTDDIKSVTLEEYLINAERAGASRNDIENILTGNIEKLQRKAIGLKN